jgi:aryl-alcohol dehydrogenase-like predicted oxidoreductase
MAIRDRRSQVLDDQMVHHQQVEARPSGRDLEQGYSVCFLHQESRCRNGYNSVQWKLKDERIMPQDQVSHLSRRRLLQLLAAGAVLPLPCWSETPKPGAILHRTIPGSGEQLPVIGLSTARVFDVGLAEKVRGPVREVLRLAARNANCVVDVSPTLGHSEQVVGELAAELGVGDGLFFAAKVTSHGKVEGVLQMQRSEQRLRRKNLDLVQVHNLVDWRTHYKTLREWKDEGRIRYIGVSHYHRSAFGALEKAMRQPGVDFVQLNYSLAEPEAARWLLPLARELGVAVLVNRPLASGFLSRKTRNRTLPGWARDFGCETWAQFFVKFVISHPAVTSAITATAKPELMEDILNGAGGRLPNAGQQRQMLGLVRSL